jgi:uracil-DNA glycosylase
MLVEGGLLAVGGSDSGAAAWVSRSGATWRAVTLPPELKKAGANLASAASRNGRAVLVGSIPAGNGSDQAGAIWVGPAGLLAP